MLKAKNKLQIGKFVKNHSSSSSGKSVTFLLVCRNLPGKANLKIIRKKEGHYVENKICKSILTRSDLLTLIVYILI